MTVHSQQNLDAAIQNYHRDIESKLKKVYKQEQVYRPQNLRIAGYLLCLLHNTNTMAVNEEPKTILRILVWQEKRKVKRTC